MSNTLKKSAETINTGADDVQRKACVSLGGNWTEGTEDTPGSCSIGDESGS